MKKYRVTVNGTAYEIELEALAESAPASFVSAPAATPVPAVPAATAPIGGEQVTAPMPGTILAIQVVQGSSIKKGDVLMILEAMKMENEIMAPCDGIIASIHTEKGAAVETGALLCVIQ